MNNHISCRGTIYRAPTANFHAPTNILRPLWQRIFRQAWIPSLVLFLLLGSLRAYGLLGPSRVRMLTLLNFFLMWPLPFVFFTLTGRSAAGLKRVEHPRWLLWAILIGAGSALVLFLIGYGLYGHSPDNWYVSILDSWAIDPSMVQLPRLQLFLIFTMPAVLFSPVGEEFFFRGLLHESVRVKWSQGMAALVNSLAFGGVHILHHGLHLDAAGLHFAPVSGMLWVLLIAGAGGLFTLCRQRSGSIWPSVLAHATFNLVMNITIFEVLM